MDTEFVALLEKVLLISSICLACLKKNSLLCYSADGLGLKVLWLHRYFCLTVKVQ